jgi:hypothetical protein
MHYLRTFATDTAGQLDILGHDGHTFGVDGAQVGIFEQSNQVGFRGFLQSKHGRSLESKIGLEVLGNFTNQTLEWKLADEQIGRLLVTTDLTKGDSSRTVTMRFLHTSGSRSGLTGSLSGELLTRSFTSGGLTSGLLGTGHLDSYFDRMRVRLGIWDGT